MNSKILKLWSAKLLKHKRILLALVAGSMIYLVCTPRNLFYLQWCHLLPFFAAIASTQGKSSFGWGWLCGTSMNLFIFYWLAPTITTFSALPGWLAIILLVLFAAWGGVLYGLIAWWSTFCQRYSDRWWPLLFASGATGLEYVFPQIFPWFQGCGQVHNFPLLQLAAATGIYGISFVVFLTNALVLRLLQAYTGQRPYPVKAVLVWLLLLLGIHSWGWQRYKHLHDLEHQSPHLGVAMIQLGLDDLQIRERYRYHWQVLQRYVRLTDQAVRTHHVQLVLWPEAAVLYLPQTRTFASLQQLVRQWGITLILGGRLRRGKHEYTTGSVLLPNGGLEQYCKVFLVPFGEYNPLESVLPGLFKAIQGVEGLSAGQRFRNFHYHQAGLEFTYTVLLCYEAIFEKIVRQRVVQGARLLVNLTKDSWFGRTDCPYQHMMLVSLKAVELGIPILRATNTGLTVYIAPTGQVYHETHPLFQEFVFIHQVPLYQVDTLYRHTGPLLPVVLLIGMALYLIKVVCSVKFGRKNDGKDSNH